MKKQKHTLPWLILIALLAGGWSFWQYGDMLKSVYDTDNNGVVDAAEGAWATNAVQGVISNIFTSSGQIIEATGNKQYGVTDTSDWDKDSSDDITTGDVDNVTLEMSGGALQVKSVSGVTGADEDDVTAADVGAASPNLDDTDASVEWEDAADLDASGQVSVGFTAISMGATNASGLAAGDAFTWGPLSHRAVTITQMWFAAVGATATSVVVDVEERAWTNLNASGSIIASNLVIAADGLLVTTFADSNIAARASLYYSCDSATGVVEQIVGGIEYVLQ